MLKLSLIFLPSRSSLCHLLASCLILDLSIRDSEDCPTQLRFLPLSSQFLNLHHLMDSNSLQHHFVNNYYFLVDHWSKLISYHFPLICYLAIIELSHFQGRRGHFHQFQFPSYFSYWMHYYFLGRFNFYFLLRIYPYLTHLQCLIYFCEVILLLWNFRKDFYLTRINYLAYHHSFHFLPSSDWILFPNHQIHC